jgi:glutathione S-transferase
MTDDAPRLPDFVRLYGGDHSPWVQAALLGLQDRKIPHRLESVPPLRVFLNSGVLMPVASFDSGPWQRDSGAILERLGFRPVSPTEQRELMHAWQGVTHRVDSAWRFWRAWSLVRDEHPNPVRRLANHFLRPFSVLYFLLILKVGSRRLAGPSDTTNADQFLYWEHRLAESPGPFLVGENPGAADLMLFGIIQCHASIPVPPLELLRTHPDLACLRAWIAAMHHRFSGYGHLYTATCFDPPGAPPRETTHLERLVFWLGSLATVIAAPLTVPLVAYYFRRVRRLGLAKPRTLKQQEPLTQAG